MKESVQRRISLILLGILLVLSGCNSNDNQDFLFVPLSQQVFSNVNYTSSDQWSVSTGAYQITENLSLTLEANNTYAVLCELKYTTNLSTSALWTQWNYTGSLANSRYQNCETYTSGTARYQAGATGSSLACSPTAAIGTQISTGVTYTASITTSASSDVLIIGFRAEAAGGNITLRRGSYCQATKLN